MPRRMTNDLLLALVLAQVLGGVLGWGLSTETARPLYDVHRALGVAIVLLAPAVRLPTGSRQTASFSCNGFPAEIWLFDSVPAVDANTWRLGVLDRSFSLADLTRLQAPKQVQAVLDCTSGWWSEQTWS